MGKSFNFSNAKLYEILPHRNKLIRSCGSQKTFYREIGNWKKDLKSGEFLLVIKYNGFETSEKKFTVE